MRFKIFCCHRRRQWILESTQSRKYYLPEKNHWDGKERKGKFHDGKSLKHKCHMDRKSGKGKILPSVQLQSNPIIGSLTPWDRKVKGSWSWRGESWNANALTIDISAQVVVLIVKEFLFIQMSLNQFSSGIHLINNLKILKKMWCSKNIVVFGWIFFEKNDQFCWYLSRNCQVSSFQ